MLFNFLGFLQALSVKVYAVSYTLCQVTLEYSDSPRRSLDVCRLIFDKRRKSTQNGKETKGMDVFTQAGSSLQKLAIDPTPTLVHANSNPDGITRVKKRQLFLKFTKHKHIF